MTDMVHEKEGSQKPTVHDLRVKAEALQDFGDRLAQVGHHEAAVGAYKGAHHYRQEADNDNGSEDGFWGPK